MDRKRILFYWIGGFLVLIFLFSFFSVRYYPESFISRSLTGRVIGTISLYVSGGLKTITIHTPMNQTYSAGIGESYNFTLNASADFPLWSEMAWKFSLYDPRHDSYTYQNQYFIPGQNFTAHRWSNELTVFARDEGGSWNSEEVTFYVEIPNSPPIISDLDDEYFACEGQSSGLFFFEGSDVDEEGASLVAIDDESGFYVSSSAINLTSRNFSFNSISALGKGDVRTYEDVQIYLTDGKVADGEDFGARSDVFNLTVIEVNNAPVPSENLGAQTIYLTGDDSVFYKQWTATDIETDSGYGELTYNISFDPPTNPFSIDSSTGLMQFTPTEKIVYPSITVCVNDSGIFSVHENFDFCSAKGYSSDPLSICDTFSLTVTDNNRLPTISSYSPLDLSFSVDGTATTIFSVEVYDADGTIPDIDWYVDGSLLESNEGVSADIFSYSFGYGVGGYHTVLVNVSDGLESTPFFWNLSVNSISAPSGDSGSGGGGGGGGGSALGSQCMEKWVCDNWGVCQNVKRSFDSRALSPEDYSNFKEQCIQSGFDERFCGFQITSCVDLASCNNTVYKVPKPVESRVCYFTEDPGCFDGITNCHSGSCELLVDCGGPCAPCPTCYDKIKNQGEEGVDCGGPCPWECEVEFPFNLNVWIVRILLVLSLMVIIFIIIKFLRIVAFHRSRKKKR